MPILNLKVFCRMHGLVVMEGMTLSGYLSNIDEIIVKTWLHLLIFHDCLQIVCSNPTEGNIIFHLSCLVTLNNFSLKSPVSPQIGNYCDAISTFDYIK